jgi:hypothetical protein
MIECDSYPVTIFIAGDIATAKQTCRQWCMDRGDCVTVEPVDYIYTGGTETGVRVGWINYPKFPRSPDEILDRAKTLAEFLRVDLCQHSYSIQTPEKTYWHSRREL